MPSDCGTLDSDSLGMVVQAVASFVYSYILERLHWISRQLNCFTAENLRYLVSLSSKSTYIIA